MISKPLLGPCDSYQLEPFEYEWAWTMARSQENNNWAPEEFRRSGLEKPCRRSEAQASLRVGDGSAHYLRHRARR